MTSPMPRSPFFRISSNRSRVFASPLIHLAAKSYSDHGSALEGAEAQATLRDAFAAGHSQQSNLQDGEGR